MPLTPPAPEFVTRLWGSRDLRAWYPERGLESEPIGEVWLTTPQDPVLIKMLFPAAPLSVQVHPDDAYAAAHGLGRGKSEAWYVLEARPGATLGVGLRPGVSAAAFAAACRAGTAAPLLHWMPVAPGDVINIPAGTVHAIGPGVVLLEAQQPSDNTFRLDDYGRGRELHLEHGLAVARATSAGPVAHGLAPQASGLLLATPFFTLTRHCLAGAWEIPATPVPRWLVNVSRADASSIPAPPPGHRLDLPAHQALPGHGRGTLIAITAANGRGAI